MVLQSKYNRKQPVLIKSYVLADFAYIYNTGFILRWRMCGNDHEMMISEWRLDCLQLKIHVYTVEKVFMTWELQENPALCYSVLIHHIYFHT